MFTRKSEEDNWKNSISINDKEYSFEIDKYFPEEELEEVFSKSEVFLTEIWQKVKKAICDDLLRMYNETWKDTEDPILNEVQFLNRIKISSIQVWWDEHEPIYIYCDDDGMFGGHWIEIYVGFPGDNRAIEASIVG